jgi:pimeloyl-ACP methyl ester carboxylesterase
MRWLVDAMGADRRALTALARSRRATVALDRIRAPTLVVAGDADPIAAQPELLARAIPGARLELLSGDHLSVLRGPRFATTLLSFLT